MTSNTMLWLGSGERHELFPWRLRRPTEAGFESGDHPATSHPAAGGALANGSKQHSRCAVQPTQVLTFISSTRCVTNPLRTKTSADPSAPPNATATVVPFTPQSCNNA